jgi:hypothetical protein
MDSVEYKTKMVKNRKISERPRTLSAAVVRALQKEGMSLREIGKHAGNASLPLVSQIRNGDRAFTERRLSQLSKSLKRPLYVLICQAEVLFEGPATLESQSRAFFRMFKELGNLE